MQIFIISVRSKDPKKDKLTNQNNISQKDKQETKESIPLPVGRVGWRRRRRELVLLVVLLTQSHRTADAASKRRRQRMALVFFLVLLLLVEVEEVAAALAALAELVRRVDLRVHLNEG